MTSQLVKIIAISLLVLSVILFWFKYIDTGTIKSPTWCNLWEWFYNGVCNESWPCPDWNIVESPLEPWSRYYSWEYSIDKIGVKICSIFNVDQPIPRID